MRDGGYIRFLKTQLAALIFIGLLQLCILPWSAPAGASFFPNPLTTIDPDDAFSRCVGISPLVVAGTIQIEENPLQLFLRVMETLKGPETEGRFLLTSRNWNRTPGQLIGLWKLQGGDRVIVCPFSAEADRMEISPYFTIWPHGWAYGDHAGTTFADAEAGARALVAVARAATAEELDRTLRNIFESPHPLTRNLFFGAEYAADKIGVSARKSREYLLPLYALDRLDDPDSRLALHAYEVTGELPESVVIVSTLRLLAKGPPMPYWVDRLGSGMCESADFGHSFFFFTDHRHPFWKEVTPSIVPENIDAESCINMWPQYLAHWWGHHRAGWISGDAAPLVLLLESDRPLQRRYAFGILKALADEDFGYHPELSPNRQPQAIARWREWLDGIEQLASPDTSAPASPPRP